MKFFNIAKRRSRADTCFVLHNTTTLKRVEIQVINKNVNLLASLHENASKGALAERWMTPSNFGSKRVPHACHNNLINNFTCFKLKIWIRTTTITCNVGAIGSDWTPMEKVFNSSSFRSLLGPSNSNKGRQFVSTRRLQSFFHSTAVKS